MHFLNDMRSFLSINVIQTAYNNESASCRRRFLSYRISGISVVHEFVGLIGFTGLGVFDITVGIFLAAADNETVVLAEAGACGDEVTADYILLHTLQRIALALDSGFVEHLGGFLEGCGGDEARCLESASGDTLKDLLGRCGLCVADNHLLEVALLEKRVLVAEAACGDNLTFLKIFAVAGVNNHFLIPDAVVFVHEVALVGIIPSQWFSSMVA